MRKGNVKLLIRNLRKMKEQETEKQALDLANVSRQRELLVAYDNFRLITPRKFSCSEECIDAFLANNCS